MPPTRQLLGPDGLPFRKDAPESGMALPHVMQFSALLSSGWRSYWHGKQDQAMRHSREDALAMRNDAFLMSLMQERKLATASLRWNIEVDDERDPHQKALQDGLARIVRRIPRFRRMLMYLLESIWYGRYASQLEWQWEHIKVPSLLKQGDELRKCLTVKTHAPINGDKIGHHWDGTPYLMVNPAYSSKLENADIHPTTSGANGLYLRGSWRWKFIVHMHEMVDGDYFDAEQADAVHGVGIRSVLYWFDWLRKEWLSNVADWCERTGLGIRLWYYQGNNPTSKAAVEKAAKEQTDRVNLLIPRTPGANAQEGVEFVDTASTGADLLLRMIQHVEEVEERFVVGQSMSGGNDKSDGLGGTGRAKLAESTKNKITEYDAVNLGETLTTDLIKTIKHWTYPEARDIDARLVFNVDETEPEKILNAAKTFVLELGGTIREDALRGAIGFETPGNGDKVLSLETVQKQLQAAQPPQPGAGGAPGAPGGDGGNDPFASLMKGLGQEDAAADEREDKEDEDQDVAAKPKNEDENDAAPDKKQGANGGAGSQKRHGKFLGKWQKIGANLRYVADLAAKLKEAAKEVHPDPTDAQREAGNFKMGHVLLHGLDISIENPKGSIRRKKGKDGTFWERTMAAHYGYIKRTESLADGDHVDVYIGPNPESEIVFIVDQVKASGAFDEHKCMLGFTNLEDAEKAYLAHYPAGWKIGGIKALTMPAFKEWIYSPGTAKPIDKQVIRFQQDGKPGRIAFGSGAIDGAHLAQLYADIWNSLGLYPDDIDEDELATVSDELSHGDAILAWKGDESGWQVESGEYPTEETGALRYAAKHSPPGGVTIKGKMFRGGQFIPNADYEKADPVTKAKIDAGANERTAKRQARGPVNVAQMHEKLQPHAHHQLGKDEMTSVKRKFGALLHHHGDLVVHRLEEVAQQLHKAYEKTPKAQGWNRDRLSKELKGVEHMLDMAEQHAKEPKEPKQGKAKAESPASAPWTDKSAPELGKVYNAPTADLHVDPERFQFKMNTNKSGVTDEFLGVKTWNPDFAGVVSVWQDPANKKTYVVNGHHRRELAGRLDVKDLAVRYIQAKDAKEARAIGALVNIAEGRGTAVDAAKFMRDTKTAPQDLDKLGVSLKGKLAQEATILTHLNDRLFDKVTRGTMDEQKALAMAKHLHNPELQDQLASLLEKREDEGKDLSNKVIEEMARKMASVPTHTKTESSLFGDITSEESLFTEVCELQAYTRAELSKEVNDFLAVASKRRAEKVGKAAGNVLDVEANKKIAEEADRVRNVFDTLVNRKGEIADAINAGAEQYAKAKGKKAKDAVKERVLGAVKNAVFREAGIGQPEPGSAGPGGTDPDQGASAEPRAEQPGEQSEAADGGRGESEPDGLKEWPAAEAAQPEAKEPAKPSEPQAEPKVEPATAKQPLAKPTVSHDEIAHAKRKLAGGNLAIKGGPTSEPLKSDLSGEAIRRHVELPGGAKIHPDELHRAIKGEDGGATLHPHENIAVKDPMNKGANTEKTFADALKGVTAYKGHDDDRVTLQSPHGYSATKTRGEWRDVAKAAQEQPGSMAAWYDRENPAAESEAARNSTARQATMGGEKESGDFFQPEVAAPKRLFDWQTPALKPEATPAPAATPPVEKPQEQPAEKPEAAAPAPAPDLRGLKGAILGQLSRSGPRGMTAADVRAALGKDGQHAQQALDALHADGRVEISKDGTVRIKGASKPAAPKPGSYHEQVAKQREAAQAKNSPEKSATSLDTPKQDAKIPSGKSNDAQSEGSKMSEKPANHAASGFAFNPHAKEDEIKEANYDDFFKHFGNGKKGDPESATGTAYSLIQDHVNYLKQLAGFRSQGENVELTPYIGDNATDELIHGVGKDTAQKIVDHYGLKLGENP